MSKGDWIKVSRTGYSHHGIDLGNGRVIHYSGELGNKARAMVRIDTHAAFANGDKVEVRRTASSPAQADQIVKRAMGRLGESRYDLVGNNCEHFARWAFKGDHESTQVRNASGVVATAAGIALGATVGTSVAASTVTVLGSQTLGAAALGLGLVSAPLWPVLAIGGGLAALIGGGVFAYQKSKKPSHR